jgi:hypothetical protein
LAKRERRNISDRTERALATAKARGVQLGNPEQAKANKHEADRYAKALRPILVELCHMPVATIPDELTQRLVAAPRGGRWHGTTGQGCAIGCARDPCITVDAIAALEKV